MLIHNIDTTLWGLKAQFSVATQIQLLRLGHCGTKTSCVGKRPPKIEIRWQYYHKYYYVDFNFSKRLVPAQQENWPVPRLRVESFSSSWDLKLLCQFDSLSPVLIWHSNILNLSSIFRFITYHKTSCRTRGCYNFSSIFIVWIVRFFLDFYVVKWLKLRASLEILVSLKGQPYTKFYGNW